MVTLGLPQSMQDGARTPIDQLHVVIEELEAEIKANQAIYEDLVQEIKAKLQKRIREVKEQVKIQPFADLQAAILAADQKVKDFKVKLDSADTANELLSSKVEALEAQNLQLQESQNEAQNRLGLVQAQSDAQKEQIEE